MKNTLKNSIKKIAAITGSAVMLGATMLGAMAAADFSTITAKTGTSEFYTTNGELNAMVMVGTMSTDVLGAISDVAGAIDVAAAFAQKATLGGEGGGAMVAKNVTPGYLDTTAGTYSDSVEYGSPAAAAQFDSTTTGFDWLKNETVVYNDTAYYMEETITTSVNNLLDNDANFYWRVAGGITFNISANQTMPLNFDQFSIGDQIYQIVAFNNVTGTLELGQVQTEDGVNVGGFVDIGTTGVKLKLTGIKQTFLAWKAVFDIYDTSVSETTPVVTGVERSSIDATYSNDTLGIKFSVNSMYKDASDIWNVDVDWTEASIVLTHNNVTDLYPNHKASIGFNNNDGINWVAFLSPGGALPADWWPKFSVGETRDLMGGLFKVTYESNRIGGDVTVDEGSENIISLYGSLGSHLEVTYEDNSSNSAGFDISSQLEMESQLYPLFAPSVFQPTLDKTYYVSYWNNVGTHSVIFRDGTTLGNVSMVDTGSNFYNDTDAGRFWWNVSVNTNQINLTLWNFTSNGSFFGNRVVYQHTGFDNGHLELTEPTNEKVYLNYNLTTGETSGGDSPLVYDKTSGTDLKFSGTSTSKYTKYGTVIAPSTDLYTLLYPQYQRVAKVYVGRTAETTETVNVGDQISTTGWYLRSGGGESPVWIFSGPTDNGIAALDSETVSRPVILVGGPGANAKVKSLYDAGTALQMNGTALTPEANTAYVELVEDAFGTYDALIIAGTGAGDTRMACKVVSSQILYGTPLTNFEGTKLKLSTGVGTYSDVTAEAYI